MSIKINASQFNSRSHWKYFFIAAALSLFFGVAVNTTQGADITPLSYRAVAVPNPVITSVSPKTCISPRGHIIVQGRNFASNSGRALAAGGHGVHVDLEIVRWSTTAIYAKIPAASSLQAGRFYYVGIEVAGHKKWLSNINLGFTLCKTKTPPPDRSPTRPTSETSTPTNENPSSTAPTGERTPSSEDTPPAPTGTTRPPMPPPTTGLPPAPPAPPAVETKKNAQDGKIVPREVMVVSANLPAAETLRTTLEGQGYKVKRRRTYKSLGLVVSVFQTPDGAEVADAIETLRGQLPDNRIDANHLYELHGQEALGAHETLKWNKSPVHCGKNLKIGLLDTESDTQHPAFQQRTLTQKSFLTAGATKAPPAHATAVVSLWIANPARSKVSGVVPQAQIYVAGVFQQGDSNRVNTTTDTLIQGLEWLVSERVDVINMSFGGPRNSIFETALLVALQKNIGLVASVGNEGPEKEPLFPASLKGVIGVTAIDHGAQVYAKANRGETVAFAAPGVDLVVAKPGGETKVVSGTSYAAPFVAATLGLSKLKHRNIKAGFTDMKLKIRDLGTKGKDSVYGWGLIQAQDLCR